MIPRENFVKFWAELISIWLHGVVSEDWHYMILLLSYSKELSKRYKDTISTRVSFLKIHDYIDDNDKKIFELIKIG